MRKVYKALLAETQKSARSVRQDLDAYLAGFFDGEGSIHIKRHRKHKFSYYVDVAAHQVNKEPLRLFVSAYGGKIYKHSNGPLSRNQCWSWRSSGKDAAWALARMLPWLIVKAEKARIALIVLHNRPHLISGGQISPYQKMAITKAVNQLRSLRSLKCR
jgi:hypothetical protein